MTVMVAVVTATAVVGTSSSAAMIPATSQPVREMFLILDTVPPVVVVRPGCGTAGQAASNRRFVIAGDSPRPGAHRTP